MRAEPIGGNRDMKTKWHRKGHDKGVREVVTRDYTHIGWKPRDVARKKTTRWERSPRQGMR